MKIIPYHRFFVQFILHRRCLFYCRSGDKRKHDIMCELVFFTLWIRLNALEFEFHLNLLVQLHLEFGTCMYYYGSAGHWWELELESVSGLCGYFLYTNVYYTYEGFHVFSWYHFCIFWDVGLCCRSWKFLLTTLKANQACIGGWICFFLLTLLHSFLEV